MTAESCTDFSWQTLSTGIEFYPIGTPCSGKQFSAASLTHNIVFFYCSAGVLTLTGKQGRKLTVHAQEILILSPQQAGFPEEFPTDVEGFLLSATPSRAEAAFSQFCSMYDLCISRKASDTRKVYLISCNLWTRSLLANLKHFPQAQQGPYLWLKTLELWYLLGNKETFQEPSPDSSMGYLALTVSAIHSYMQCHMDEKMTIVSLSQKYGISPTSLKNCFRALYGQPIHRWLQQYRMEQAARMLANSYSTVLQIAQEVGYESVGQFNVSFKKHYGLTPSQYRKKSVSSFI